MIAAWMLHAVLVGGLLALAARAAEWILSAYRLPVRWAWAGAAAGALTLPAAAAAGLPARLASLLPLPAAAGGGAALTVPGGPIPGLPPAPSEGVALPALPDAAPFLLAAWAAGSLLLSAAWARAWLRLRRRRREHWEPASVEDVEVLLSGEDGPAVVGLAHPVIVLPGWVLDLSRDERRLVLRHELEHRRARDPALLAFGLAVLVAVPWNPAAWWAVRRLRLAVELDCDRRVLAGGATPGRYGALLLNVTRDRRRGAVPAAALVERPSQLERRIRAMTDAIPKFRGVRASLVALVGAGLLAAACDAPTPAEAPEAGGDEVATIRGVDVSPVGADTPPSLVNAEEVSRRLLEGYRREVRDPRADTVTLRLRVDSRGNVSRARVLSSSGNEALDRTVVSAARHMVYEPAVRDGEPVGVSVVRQFTFGRTPGAPYVGLDEDAYADRGELHDSQRPPSGRLPEADTLRSRRPEADSLRARGDRVLDLDAGGTSPLIFLDGERLEDDSPRLAELRPDRIEAIEVVEGRAAVAIHGVEARDGVIRITTKPGPESR